MSAQQTRIARQLHREGHTNQYIAECLNVTKARVGHILNVGREPRDPVAPFVIKPEWTPHQTKKQRTAFIIKHYRKGVSVVAIMKATGLTESGVRVLLSYHKVGRGD
jgi:hypothetical protein